MPAIRGAKSKKKTRRGTRGLDLVFNDIINPYHLKKHLDGIDPASTPGLGQFYCVACAKHFESEANFLKHRKAKPHKRRIRQLREEPYTQKEAEAAVGLTTDNGKKPIDELEMEDIEEDSDDED